MSEAQVPPVEKKDVCKFHWIKSNFFRVVHADGVWGGVTPTGNIQMAVFSQRTPIPQQTANKVIKGELVDEVAEMKIAKDGYVREVEVDIVMDLALAILVRKWLDDKIQKLESTRKGS